MSARSFLDTNVLLYTDDHDAPGKEKLALSLIERCREDRGGVFVKDEPVVVHCYTTPAADP